MSGYGFFPDKPDLIVVKGSRNKALLQDIEKYLAVEKTKRLENQAAKQATKKVRKKVSRKCSRGSSFRNKDKEKPLSNAGKTL